MKRIWLMSLLPLTAPALSSYAVQKTEEGEAPEVEVEPGNLPEYEVDPALIEMKKDTETVVVPKIEIKRDTITKGQGQGRTNSALVPGPRLQSSCFTSTFSDNSSIAV